MESPEQSACPPVQPGPDRRRHFDASLWLVAATLAAVSVFAFWLQPAAINPLAPTFADRWLRPIEVNPAARFPLVPAADLHALWFFSAREGLVAGEKGVLLRTGDSGRTWRRVALSADGKTPVSDGIYALAFSAGDPRRGFLAGRNGLWLASSDGGERWTDYRLVQNSASGFTARQAKAPLNARYVDVKQAVQGPPPQVQQGPAAESMLPPHIYALAITPDETFAATSRGLMRRGAAGGAADLMDRSDGWQVATAGSQVWWTASGGYGSADQSGGAMIGALANPGEFDAVAGRNETILFAGRRVALTRRGGTISPVPLPDATTTTRVWACALASDRTGWIVGNAGRVWRVGRSDDGRIASESRAVPDFDGALYAVWAFSENAAVVAGADGAMFRTENTGRTWAPLTANCWPAADRSGRRYWRLPALWFYPVFGLMAWVGYRRWRTRPPLCIEHDAIAAELTTDRALMHAAEDRLGFVRHVNGLSRYLRNAATEPPLTLAITGAWGSGKTSFMNLLRADLQRYGLSTVWFNAWHHQQESQILAPLLQAIRSEGTPSFFSSRVDVALRFRLRLLWRRLLAQRVLLFVLLVLLCVALGVRERLHAPTPIAALAHGVAMLSDGHSVEEGLANLVGGGSFVGLVLGFALLAWRAAVLFGVNPAALLATESGKSSQLALTEQTDFRRQFAARFHEVTDALKPYPLVVFVDDLDRCTAAKIFQILEAINYVVSSGDCFVVLGMDEERVRECVARYFLVSAPDAPADELRDPNPPAGRGGSSGKASEWTRAHTTAKAYLEKLVQLRVDVPTTGMDAIGKMAATSIRGLDGGAASLVGRIQPHRWQFTALAAAAVVVVCSVAFLGGRAMAPAFTRDAPATAQTPSGPPSTGSINPAVMPPALANLDGAPGVEVDAAPRFRERDLTITDPDAGARDWSGAIAAIIGVLGVAVVAMLGQRELRRRQVTVVRDSAEFALASTRWSQELKKRLGDAFTPRALKRFKNRVRYYSMALRDEGAPNRHGLRDRVIVAIGALEQMGIAPQELSGVAVNLALPPELKDAADEAAVALLDQEATTEFEKLAETTQMRA
jgi:photosystem II stability/assembly factor-like uncharacterized protein